MEHPVEIEDETFGRLSLVDDSVYLAEVPWNRGLNIQLFIHVEGGNRQKYFEKAKTTFTSVCKNEMELFNKGVESLIAIGTISDSDDYKETFLSDAAETSIEINSSGEGQLVYLVMMLGTLIIEFSHDATFLSAQAMAG